MVVISVKSCTRDMLEVGHSVISGLALRCHEGWGY